MRRELARDERCVSAREKDIPFSSPTSVSCSEPGRKGHVVDGDGIGFFEVNPNYVITSFSLESTLQAFQVYQISFSVDYTDTSSVDDVDDTRRVCMKVDFPYCRLPKRVYTCLLRTLVRGIFWGSRISGIL